MAIVRKMSVAMLDGVIWQVISDLSYPQSKLSVQVVLLHHLSHSTLLLLPSLHRHSLVVTGQYRHAQTHTPYMVFLVFNMWEGEIGIPGNFRECTKLSHVKNILTILYPLYSYYRHL